MAKQTLVNVFNVVWENWPKAKKWGYICSRVTKYSCLSWFFFPWEKSTGYLNMYFYNTPKMIKTMIRWRVIRSEKHSAHHWFLHVFMWTKQLTAVLRNDSSLFPTFNLSIHTSALNNAGQQRPPHHLSSISPVPLLKQVDNRFSGTLAFTTNTVYSTLVTYSMTTRGHAVPIACTNLHSVMVRYITAARLTFYFRSFIHLQWNLMEVNFHSVCAQECLLRKQEFRLHDFIR